MNQPRTNPRTTKPHLPGNHSDPGHASGPRSPRLPGDPFALCDRPSPRQTADAPTLRRWRLRPEGGDGSRDRAHSRGRSPSPPAARGVSTWGRPRAARALGREPTAAVRPPSPCPGRETEAREGPRPAGSPRAPPSASPAGTRAGGFLELSGKQRPPIRARGGARRGGVAASELPAADPRQREAGPGAGPREAPPIPGRRLLRPALRDWDSGEPARGSGLKSSLLVGSCFRLECPGESPRRLSHGDTRRKKSQAYG